MLVLHNFACIEAVGRCETGDRSASLPSLLAWPPAPTLLRLQSEHWIGVEDHSRPLELI